MPAKGGSRGGLLQLPITGDAVLMSILFGPQLLPVPARQPPQTRRVYSPRK